MNTTHMKNTTGLIRKWFTRSVACMALLFAGQSAHATTYTWANSNVAGNPAASLNWFNATQGAWTGGTPAINDNTTTIQFFQDTTTALLNNGANQTQISNIDNGGSAFELGTLTLSGKGGSTSSKDLTMTISGNALNFSAATGKINLDAVNGFRTITYNVNSAIQLGTVSSASALTLTGDGTVTFNIGGIISELQAGGGSLIKSGSSTVTLSGANTYTGGTTINAGTLKVGNATALGANTSAVSVTSGAVLDVNGITMTGTNALTLNGTGIGGTGALVNNSGTANTVYAGTVTLGSDSTIGAIGNRDFSLTGGTIGGSGNLTLKVAALGRIFIGGVNNTGTITNSGAGTNSVTISGLIGANVTAVVQNSATSGLLLSGNNTSAVPITITAGTVSLQGTQSLSGLISGAGNLTAGNPTAVGTSVTLTGANTYAGLTRLNTGTLSVGSLNSVSGGSVSSNLGAPTTAANGTIAFGNNVLGATLAYTGAGETTDRVINLAGTAGGAVIDQSGASGLLKFTSALTATGIGSKTLTLQGSTGGTGEIAAAIVNNTTTGSTVATANSSASTALVLGSVDGLTAGNAISGTGIPALTTISSINTATKTVTLSAAATVSSGAVITSAGAVNITSLTKAGTGTWTLSGVNTYTGTTTVSAGKLIIGSGGSLAAGSAVTVSGGAIGGTGTIGGAVSLTTAGGMNLRDGSVGTLTLGSTLASSGAAGANNLYFDLGNGTGTSDLLSVAGTISVTTSGAPVINLSQLGGFAGRTATTYTLIGGAGTLDATNFGKFSLATTKAFGQTYTLVHDTVSDGGSGNLQVTAANVTASAGNVTLGGTNPSWTLASNFTPANLPDYASNVSINSAIGTTGALNASQNINSLNYGTSATTATTVAPGTAAAGTPFNMLVIEAAGVNGNTAGNGITLNSASGTHTISANIGLAASQTWTVTNASAGLVVSGAISDFGLGNSLTKTGAGTLILSGVNTFSGNIYIKAGTLADQLGVNTGDTRNWGAPTATIYLGETGSSADATLATQSNAGYNGPASSINPIIVQSGSGARIIRVLAGVTSKSWIGGDITLNNNLQFIYNAAAGVDLRISGNITGTGNLTFASTTGGSPISLTGASINPVGAITNSSQGTNNISISGAIGANVTGIVQNGATSTLTLSGTNNLYAGTTTVLLGTLETTKTNSLGVASSLVIADGAKMYLNFTGTNTITSLKLGNVTMPKGVYGTNAPLNNLIFSGLGKLKVTTGPAKGTLVYIY